MSVRILTGCARDRLRDLPDASVHTIVTSPPYFGLRDYGVAGQIGLEETPDAYVAALVDVFRACRRVMRNDGTVWLNLGDSYAMSTKGAGGNGKQHSNAGSVHADRRWRIPLDLKSKDLIGIPWRVAFALQADGWYLRSDIIWAKPNPMPESVTDRPTSAHEHIFLLSKRPTYYYDAEAVKEDALTDNREKFRGNDKYTGGNSFRNSAEKPAEGRGHVLNETGVRNLRNVWTVATQPYSEAHFATFPPALIEPCIKAGCPEKCCPHCGAGWERTVSKSVEAPSYRPTNKPITFLSASEAGQGTNGTGNSTLGMTTKAETLGFRPTCSCPIHEPISGTVLDPFGGAGTTGLVADRLGRNAILIELSEAYAAMAERRIYADLPMFANVTLEAAE